jgi:hypothetical protein
MLLSLLYMVLRAVCLWLPQAISATGRSRSSSFVTYGCSRRDVHRMERQQKGLIRDRVAPLVGTRLCLHG